MAPNIFKDCEFKDVSAVPMGFWRWPNFTPAELASKGDGKLLVDSDALDKLQALRTALGVPIGITSAYRSPSHNRNVGGALNSQHLKARAYDCRMDKNHDPVEFEKAARAVGFTGFGFYPRSNFIHIDTGPAREWGKRWTVENPPIYGNATPLPLDDVLQNMFDQQEAAEAPEPKEKPKPLRRNRSRPRRNRSRPRRRWFA